MPDPDTHDQEAWFAGTSWIASPESDQVIPAFVKALWEMEDVLKTHEVAAGPMRYCLDPSTPVLTADLQWICVEDLAEGDRLAAFEEEPDAPQCARRWREATVEHVGPVELPSYRIGLADGATFIASAHHRWLVRTAHRANAHWVTTADLRTSRQCFMLRITRTWRHEADWSTGYLAAAFDGEGSITQTRMASKASGRDLFQSNLSFAQRPNVMLDTVDKVGGAMGFVFGDYASNRSGVRTRRIMGGKSEMLRFLGTVRPQRILDKLAIDRLGDMRTIDHVQVVDLEPIGVQPLIAVQTSTRTLIAYGFASHNSYADLGDVLAEIRPKLRAQRLAMTQTPTVDSGVTTTLFHESGQWIRFAPLLIRPTGGTAQNLGSAITYAKRYSAQSIMALATEDDDGHAASVAATPPPEKPPENPLTGRVDAALHRMTLLAEPAKAKMREWANAEGRKLSGKALYDEAEWLSEVEAWLDVNEEANDDTEPPEEPF